MAVLRLYQETGAHAGRSLHLEKLRVRLGRSPDNDVVFDPNVDLDASGHHCELLFEQGHWVVVDNASRNGTYLNGVRIQRARVNPQDVLECGRGGPRLRVDPTPALAVPPAVPASAAAAGTVAGGPAFLPPPLANAPAAPFPPAPAPGPVAAGQPPRELSVGEAMASQLPQGAQVGKRTMAFMIDQAVARASVRRTSPTFKVAFAALTVLVVTGLSVLGFYVWDERERRNEDRQGPGPPSGDPSTAGARLAAANEANIYLLAFARPNDRDRGFCTGFAVTAAHIATNAHCIRVAQDEERRGARLFALRNKSPGTRLPISLAYLDARWQNRQQSRGGTGYDVGLVRAAQPLPSWVRLAPDADLFALHEGDAIFVYGFPGMTMNEASPVATITLGLLNRVTDFFDSASSAQGAQKLQHSAQTSGGSSGSPIFLPSGVVVGINAGSLADDERQIVFDPVTHQQREVEVNRGSNFKYGMRADLLRQALAAVQDLPR
jgi:V8-like Glu-specific endopeptidase